MVRRCHSHGSAECLSIRMQTYNQATHAFRHPVIAIFAIRKRVADLWYNINGGDAFVIREVVSIGHGFVCEDVKFLGILISCPEKNIQVMCNVRSWPESQAYGRPT